LLVHRSYLNICICGVELVQCFKEENAVNSILSYYAMSSFDRIHISKDQYP